MISVKDVVLLAAEFVGVKEKVDDYLSGVMDEEHQRLVDGFVCCYNVVENELAVDYLPLVKEEQMTAKDGKIAYADLSQKAAYIIGVFDEYGNSAPHKRMASYLAVGTGKYLVRYAALPVKKAFDDDSEYAVGVSERLLAYGVAAEYCLHKGLSAESAAWEKKYKKAVAETFRAKELKTIKAGYWV